MSTSTSTHHVIAESIRVEIHQYEFFVSVDIALESKIGENAKGRDLTHETQHILFLKGRDVEALTEKARAIFPNAEVVDNR